LRLAGIAVLVIAVLNVVVVVATAGAVSGRRRRGHASRLPRYALLRISC